MTAKQHHLIRQLLDERMLSDEQRTEALRRLPGLSVPAASRWIDRLFELPRRPRGAPVPPEVEDGHYALDVPGDSMTGFFRVNTWRGTRYLDQQASDEFYPVKGDRRTEAVVAALIEAGPEARARYGQLIGKCGICNRTLTDETSRSIGIGPVCRAGRR
jgi:hypothetical protein